MARERLPEGDLGGQRQVHIGIAEVVVTDAGRVHEDRGANAGRDPDVDVAGDAANGNHSDPDAGARARRPTPPGMPQPDSAFTGNAISASTLGMLAGA